MIIPKLALRNILGAGLRTWLNVVVLSFAFVAIIWTQGLYEGMNAQAERASVDALPGRRPILAGKLRSARYFVR